jgi:hypothetical protein
LADFINSKVQRFRVNRFRVQRVQRFGDSASSIGFQAVRSRKLTYLAYKKIDKIKNFAKNQRVGGSGFQPRL